MKYVARLAVYITVDIEADCYDDAYEQARDMASGGIDADLLDDISGSYVDSVYEDAEPNADTYKDAVTSIHDLPDYVFDDDFTDPRDVPDGDEPDGYAERGAY